MKPAGTFFTAPRSSEGDKDKPGPRRRLSRPMISRRKKLSDAELGWQIRAGGMGTLVAVTHHAGSSTNGVFYAPHNHRGEITLARAVTATVGRYGCSAFGILHSALGPDMCRFKFSSKEWDAATGFSYYGYRFYAPQWQRWPNRDSIEERAGLNLYGFVRNNPNTFVDLDGREAVAIPFPTLAHVCPGTGGGYAGGNNVVIRKPGPNGCPDVITIMWPK